MQAMVINEQCGGAILLLKLFSCLIIIKTWMNFNI